MKWNSYPISLTEEEVFACAVLAIAGVFALVLWLAPAAGISLAEAGFPLLAAWILYRNRGNLFAPAASFPAIYLLWYWVGSVTFVPANDLSTLFNPFDARQWLLYVIGFLGLWSGLYLIRAGNQDATRLRGLSVQWNVDLFFLLLAGATAAFLLAWAIIISKEGITILRDDVETLRVAVSADNHITFQILMLTKLIFPLIYLYLWTASPVARLRKTLHILGIAIVLILTSTGNRSMALDTLMVVFALRHFVRRSYKAWHLFVAALTLALMLSVSGYYRAIQHSGTTHQDNLIKMGFPPAVQPFTDIYLYVRAPLDTLRNVTQQIPAHTPYQYGALTAGVFSQLLPGRHPSVDLYFKDLVGGAYDGLGLPASILGQFYGDFGLIGVFLGMFLCGVISRVLYGKMLEGSFVFLLLYCFFWEVLIQSLYGAFFPYVVQIMIPIAWIAILWLVVERVRYPGPRVAMDQTHGELSAPALS